MGRVMRARILVVDDEAFLRRLLTYMLTGVGYEIECAEDGQQAWERLCGADPPDLVISDFMMPGMTGLDLVRRLREQGDRHIPVLILTARGQGMIDEQEARRSGADAFMTKPFSSRDLLEKIEVLLAPGAADDAGATGTDG
jgi:CheY-like chemotaxis protein